MSTDWPFALRAHFKGVEELMQEAEMGLVCVPLRVEEVLSVTFPAVTDSDGVSLPPE